MRENVAAAVDRVCRQLFSAAVSHPHTPTPSLRASSGSAIPVSRTSALQSWQAGCGCEAAWTHPCAVLRAAPEDGAGLDICVVSTGGSPAPGCGPWLGPGAGGRAAGSTEPSSEVQNLPVTLKPSKWCHNNSSAPLTLSSREEPCLQLGKLEPSGVYRADQQHLTERNLPFHRANRTLSERRLLLVVQLGWDLGFKNQTEVTSLGALVKWDWPYRLGDHLWDTPKSFHVSHWGSLQLCCSDCGNSMREASNPRHCYLHCPEFTSPCYSYSWQRHLEVREQSRNSIWSGENIVCQLWTSPLVMLRAVVRLFDSAASSYRPWVRGRQGKFLSGSHSVSPSATCWAPWSSGSVGGRRVPKQRMWLASSQVGFAQLRPLFHTG